MTKVSLPEALSREIERVTILRAAAAVTSASGCDPYAAMKVKTMTQAIEAAHRASGDGDPAAMITALKWLKEFQT